jgi:flagellar basal body rod protein FlgG
LTDRIFNIGESGIEAADERVKSLMNNMVNAETPGFKRTDVVQRAFPLELEAAEKKLSAMRPQVEGAYYDHAPGALIRTGSPTDIAIGGDGYFVIGAPWGEGYTRDGRFVLDKEGQLVTVSGNYPVLGERGPIVVPAGSRLEVSSSGDVKVDGAAVDKIRLVSIGDKNLLEPVSGSIFRVTSSEGKIEEVSSPSVIQGYMESSNVRMVDEMMNLVMVSRLYGINVKLVQTRDANLAKAVTMGSPTQ